jgi:Acetyltransferase (GNAT) domain
LRSIRPFRDGDETGVDALLKTCFPSYRGIKYWNWMHKYNPLGFHGEEGDVWVAESNSRIVGYYGRIRYKIWFFGQSAYAVQGTQISTHPGLRRNGIALGLFLSAAKRLKKIEVKFSFGYPNEHSYQAYKKFASSSTIDGLDFIDVRVREPLRIFNREEYLRSRYPKLHSRARAYLSLLPEKPLHESEVDCCEQFDISKEFRDDAGSVWSSVRQFCDIGIERSTEYLRWRYNPIWGNYEVISATEDGITLGYAVLKVTKRREVKGILICELLTLGDQEVVYDFLIKEILKRAHALGAAYIQSSESCLHGCATFLKKNGFEVPRMPLNRTGTFSSHLVATVDVAKTPDQLKGARWYHSIGDKDFA